MLWPPLLVSPPCWFAGDGRQSFKEKQDAPPFSDYVDRPFDFDLFYSFFPEFMPPEDGSTPTYSQSFLSAAAKQAAMFVRVSNCRELDGPDRLYAFNLCVAHMAVLLKRRQSALPGTSVQPTSAATGNMDAGPGVVTSASVGGVSVSKGQMMQPRNHWEEWYYQTPYGRDFLAFLSQKTAAGFYYEGEENIAFLLR